MDMNKNYKMTIDGKMVAGASTIDVVNPATGEVFAQAPDCSPEQLDQAVESSRRAFQSWKKLSFDERADYLRKAADALTAAAPEMARLFTREQGRPVGFAEVEIATSGDWLKGVCEMRPPVDVHEDSETQFIETSYVPLGVVCAIAPWNFPVSLAIWKIAPALLSGNTMVLKPSPFTPLSTLKMGEIFAEILKRVTLELGGNDAAIVMPDVDLDEVAEKIFFGTFFNTAQICVATKRLYVHEDVYDGLRDRLIAMAEGTKLGDGSEQGTDMGPIQNIKQFERVKELLEDAKDKGLNVIECSKSVNEDGYFIPITIVDNPPEDTRVVQEEAFGPILPMLKFKDVDDVVGRANDSEYGLAGAVWSKDEDKALEIARRMETGTVWINQNLFLLPNVPFAGHKNSGFGAENGMKGLLEYMAPQSIYLARAQT